jgi:predicted nucleic acid-binding protein
MGGLVLTSARCCRNARSRCGQRHRIYAEFSIGYTRIEDVDRVLAGAGLELIGIPRAALFLAGKVFQHYRARGGSRTGVLPDFFIGAHAAVAQLPLLTRDPSHYRRYFSGIALITPDTEPI